MTNEGQPVSSLKDKVVARLWVDDTALVKLTDAEAVIAEIERERDELAQQRGDMLRHVIALRVTLAGAREHIQAARDELYECHAGPDGAVDALGQEGLDEDDEMLRRIDLALSINVASESQPSEMPK